MRRKSAELVPNAVLGKAERVVRRLAVGNETAHGLRRLGTRTVSLQGPVGTVHEFSYGTFTYSLEYVFGATLQLARYVSTS